MEELLDPRGVWDMSMVELMLPVAAELHAQETRAVHVAVRAAAASLFDRKAAREFARGLDQVMADVREAQRGARGELLPAKSAAAALVGAFAKIGVRPARRRAK